MSNQAAGPEACVPGRPSFSVPEDPEVSDAGPADLSPELVRVLQDAIRQCSGIRYEEDGGVLVESPDGKVSFVHLANSLSGQARAGVLYMPSPEEYGRRVVSRFGEGLLTVASFHTHPNGMPALPSGIDLRYLFRGFPQNYIWSPEKRDLRRYAFVPDARSSGRWRMEIIRLPQDS